MTSKIKIKVEIGGHKMSEEITLNSKILVIDDSMLILKFIQEMLKDKYEVQLAFSAEKAYAILESYLPDLILLDLEMPKIDGYQVLAQLKGTAKWRDIPVVFLTGMNDREKEEKALSMGAVDYILKPISAGVLRKRIQMHLELTAYQRKLESIVNTKTEQLLITQDLILDILANVTTYRDNDTGAHIIRTTNYSRLLVEKLLEEGRPDYLLSEAYAQNIIKSARLHDIGKIAIPDEILLKSEGLTPEEFEIIKMHTCYGAQMISNAITNLGDNASFLVTAREIILHHHERWDGSGYPDQLKGTDIPLSARIMAIADVYDALISSRPYKNSYSHEKAVEIMKSEAGIHFDAGLMEMAESIFPYFRDIADAFRDE